MASQAHNEDLEQTLKEFFEEDEEATPPPLERQDAITSESQMPSRPTKRKLPLLKVPQTDFKSAGEGGDVFFKPKKPALKKAGENSKAEQSKASALPQQSESKTPVGNGGDNYWTSVTTPLALHPSPLISLYMCPRCIQYSSQRSATRFQSGTHYITLVQCSRCVTINRTLTSVTSGLPFYAPKPEDKKE